MYDAVTCDASSIIAHSNDSFSGAWPLMSQGTYLPQLEQPGELGLIQATEKFICVVFRDAQL